MKAIFISDAHLIGSDEENFMLVSRFIDELSTAVNKVDRLYIVGDFFDFWFAKGNTIFSSYESIVEKIVALHKSGVAVHIIEGNHEFFMKEYFNRFSIEVAEDYLEFHDAGKKFFISHGDKMCEKSKWSKLLKLFLKSELAYFLKELFPLEITWALARSISRASRRHGSTPGKEISVAIKTVATKKIQGGYDAVIFGHSHQPSLSSVDENGRKKIVATLGDWLTNYTYLYYENGHFEMRKYR